MGVYITIPLDVDPKMYFHCTDLLQGVSFFYELRGKQYFCLCLLGVGLVALTACLKLHEFLNHLIQSASAVGLFSSLGHILVCAKPACSHFSFWILFQALKKRFRFP